MRLYALNGEDPTGSGTSASPRNLAPIWRTGRARDFCAGSTRPVTTRSTTRSPRLREGLRLGRLPAGPRVRGHRIPPAHCGGAAASDRARHRGRTRARLAELHRRRAEIDAEIAAVESGVVTVLDPTGSATATNSSRPPPANCSRLPRGRGELPAARPRRPGEDRRLGGFQG